MISKVKTELNSLIHFKQKFKLHTNSPQLISVAFNDMKVSFWCRKLRRVQWSFFVSLSPWLSVSLSRIYRVNKRSMPQKHSGIIMCQVLESARKIKHTWLKFGVLLSNFKTKSLKSQSWISILEIQCTLLYLIEQYASSRQLCWLMYMKMYKFKMSVFQWEEQMLAETVVWEVCLGF